MTDTVYVLLDGKGIPWHAAKTREKADEYMTYISPSRVNEFGPFTIKKFEESNEIAAN